MDFSNYPESHPLKNNTRKNKLFFFKDELKGDRMTKFVGLRAKSYSYVTNTLSSTQKLKGVTKAYRGPFNFKAYLSCLKKLSSLSVSQFHIRSRDHVITVNRAERVALTSYDSNRYV